VRSTRLDAGLLASHHQSSPLASSKRPRSYSRPDWHRHDRDNDHQLFPGVNRGRRNTGCCLCIRCDSDGVPAIAPNVMHALIWEQSRGKPWLFTTSNGDQLSVHPTPLEPCTVCGKRVPLMVGSVSDRPGRRHDYGQ
jgi:hypothetical protein